MSLFCIKLRNNSLTFYQSGKLCSVVCFKFFKLFFFLLSLTWQWFLSTWQQRVWMKSAVFNHVDVLSTQGLHVLMLCRQNIPIIDFLPFHPDVSALFTHILCLICSTSKRDGNTSLCGDFLWHNRSMQHHLTEACYCSASKWLTDEYLLCLLWPWYLHLHKAASM